MADLLYCQFKHYNMFYYEINNHNLGTFFKITTP